MSNKRILLSAYACEPGFGSEAGIGWNWTRQVSQRYDTWLITRENNVEKIQEAAHLEGLDRLHVVGFDLPAWARFWKRGSRGAMLYFYLWQLAMGRRARKLDREFDFDVVHHLTFASSWIPSGLASIDKPFVWGPVGQHPRIPDRFLMREDVRTRLGEVSKAAIKNTLLAVDPFVKRTHRHANRILSLGGEFSDRLDSDMLDKLEPCLACGTEPQDLPPNRFFRTETFRVLYAGRLVDLKGVRLVIDAFARFALSRPEARLELLGDGPRRSWIERRIAQLGLGDKVTLHGSQTQERTQELMHTSDVFLFPSFEGAGMVVPEAMAAGNPVVCLDFGGPGEMVGEDRGLRAVVGGSIAETVANLTAALENLASDEDKRRRLARQAAHWAASETTWDAKGAGLDSIYQGAIEHYAEEQS
jgi:glycosyltransferase involved in cell wall biosynthesis